MRVGFPVKYPRHAALFVLMVGLMAHSRSSGFWICAVYVVALRTTVLKASSCVYEPS